MEERKNEEVLYKLSPRFSLIYELFMPTGRKIKSTITILIVMCVATIFFFSDVVANVGMNDIMFFENMSIFNLLTTVCIVVDILLVLKLFIHIVFQVLQYKHITYTFYKSHMVYEDDFLNQHRKNIEYSNIKEVEIRRTILDRILGYGVIVIYTNAENNRNNGMVIYAIKNPKKSYDIIYNIIHDNKEIVNEIKKDVIDKEINELDKNSEVTNEDDNISKNSNDGEILSVEVYSSEVERQKRVEENKREEEEFLDSLKNINDGNEN